MSIVVLKKNIKKYFEEHAAEIMCSLAALSDDRRAFESYLLLRKKERADGMKRQLNKEKKRAGYAKRK